MRDRILVVLGYIFPKRLGMAGEFTLIAILLGTLFTAAALLSRGSFPPT